MAKQHKGISWTDDTWNPIVGCTKVSNGCRNCWAERMARLHYNKDFPNGWDGHVKLIPERLELPLRWRKPRKIAVGLMGDIFHPDVPDEFIDKVFQVVLDAPQHIFQILTKRPLRMMDYITQFPWGRVPDNLWLGISVEDQKTADERIPLLLETPGAVRWVSYEPALGPIVIDFFPDWIICGGESGPGARPIHPDWVRSVRDQCVAAGVPFHFKQHGCWLHASQYCDCKTDIDPSDFYSWYPKHVWSDIPNDVSYRIGKKDAGHLLDGKEWLGFPEVKL